MDTNNSWLDEAKALREQGLSYPKIAAALGIHYSRVYRALNPGCRAREYANNREKILAKAKEYYKENQERIKDRQREYERAHRKEALERCRDWRERNREKYRAYLESWAQNNRDKVLEYAKKYRESHREECAARIAKWRVENKDKSQSYVAIRRARAAISPEVRHAVLEIYKLAVSDSELRCYLCGEIVPQGQRHVDHIVPIAKEGKTVPDNLAIACSRCNTKKGGRMLDELPPDFFTNAGGDISAPASK